MKHILVVDDVSTNLKCVGAILQDKYRVTALKSGEDALKFLEAEIPDLILLDVKMQGLDGYAVMERLKADAETAKIPVILLTADCEPESEKKGRAAGAADFIGKPFEPKQLLKSIANVLKEEQWEKDR